MGRSELQPRKGPSITDFLRYYVLSSARRRRRSVAGVIAQIRKESACNRDYRPSGQLLIDEQEITGVLREWLPRMFDHIDPWASEVDIDAGSRGFDEIQARLNQSSFGIIVITTQNYERPWLNFEAGALSKPGSTDGDRGPMG